MNGASLGLMLRHMLLVCCAVPCCAVTACLPEPKGACLGKVSTGTPDWERIAAEAARTVPGRGKHTPVHALLALCNLLRCEHNLHTAWAPLIDALSISRLV